MHKRPVIAVLALGLLLLTAPLAFGAVSAADDDVDVRLRSQGGQSITGTLDLEAATDPVVTVQAGTPRVVPGTFCDGQWQGPFTFTVGGGFISAAEFVAARQDPSDPTWFGPGCTLPTFPFNVTAINTIDRFSAGPFPATFLFQPLVLDINPAWADLNVFGEGLTVCDYGPAPVAGGILCAGPMYAVTWTAAASFIINLPFDVDCCVNGPYFAACYKPTGGSLRVATDGPLITDVEYPCGTFWDFIGDEPNGFWANYDVFKFLFPWTLPAQVRPRNLLTWSEGYTPDDPGAFCTGVCDWQWWYIGSASDCSPGDVPGTRQNGCWFANHPIPDFLETDINGERPEMWVRYEAIGLDTLEAVEVLMGAFDDDGTISMRVSVYEADPINVSPICGGRIPGALRGFVDVAGPFSLGPPTYVDLSAIPASQRVFGTLDGGPITHFFVGLSLSPWVDPNFNDLAPAYGDVVQDFVNPICPGVPPHSGAFFPTYLPMGGTPQHLYLGEFKIRRGGAGLLRYRHGEIWMDAYMCKEHLRVEEADCGPGGPDQWASFAHDNQRTSASNVNVGDPNGIVLEWSKSLPFTCNFNNPTIAKDKVYVSSDQRLQVYDLAAPGALLGEMGAALGMGSSNRGNTTVATVAGAPTDLVFATTGNFNAIAAMGPLLNNSAVDYPPLGRKWAFSFAPAPNQQNRFNTSIVVGGVLYVVTEPSAGTGRLYALDALNGGLWLGGGWATNPIILDHAAKHGPAYNPGNGKLYVGTAEGGTNVDGSLYEIDAATGAVTPGSPWNDVIGDGFPAGVSLEGNFLYTHTRNIDNSGRRYKIDVSSWPPTPATIMWKAAQSTPLYGTPTIGRKFVYFPIDNGNTGTGGVIMVNKDIGVAVHNFAAEGVGLSPCIATLSCDAYLFAGDRNAKWWLFNTVDQTLEWYRQYPIPGAGIVQGSALATHSGGGRYVAVNIRESSPGGRLSVYRMTTNTRPRLIVHKTDITVEIPLGTGLATHVEPDALENVGNATLNFTASSVTDPLPDAAASLIDRARAYSASVQRNMYTGTDYESYFADSRAMKTASMITKGSRPDGEFSNREYNEIIAPYEALDDAAKGSHERRMFAAGAALGPRIDNTSIKVNGSLIPAFLGGGSGPVSLSFDFNGSVPQPLGRGTDLEVIHLVNDDPDFSVPNTVPGPSTADINILLVGGCAEAMTELHFNDVPGGANTNIERVYNNAGLGDQGTASDLYWANDPIHGDVNFDIGFFIAADSIAGPPSTGGALLRIEVYRGSSSAMHGMFVADPAPVTDACGFYRQDNVLLGRKRDLSLACPGAPIDINGEIIQTSFSDTNQTAVPGSRQSAIGVSIDFTEVGAYDPQYGDFKLIRWHMKNRTAVQLGPLYPGTIADWDVVGGAAGSNDGRYSDNANGYYIWNDNTPSNAYGMLDYAQLSGYCGADPTTNSPYRIGMYFWNPDRQNPGPWTQDTAGVWHEIVNEQPLRIYDDPGVLHDRAGILVNAPVTIPVGESRDVYQALFSTFAQLGDPDLIEPDVVGIAGRAAKWSGWARGDVNDDGCVDLGDVCWLEDGALPLYPGDWNGDVDVSGGAPDAADVARLLAYVSGDNTMRPLGAWRF